MGRAHSCLLAERGAAVVVNDVGAALSGEGADPGPAQEVVNEIVDSGGTAVASVHSVASPAGARAIVDTALEAFGRLDILVANAAIYRRGLLGAVAPEDLSALLSVNAIGTWEMVQAAWPHMVEQGYGRIVCIVSSASVLGMPDRAAYGFAKGAVSGLVRTAALEGIDHGIRVNALAPGARSRMSSAQDPGWVRFGDEHQRAEFVSPAVAILAHESCPTNGAHFSCLTHAMSEIVTSETLGFTAPPEVWTPELIIEHWAEVVDRSALNEPRSAGDSMAAAVERIGIDPAAYGIDLDVMRVPPPPDAPGGNQHH